ncbi:MAG: tryptophan--tRNA ligase, partial [Candidatus Pacebacteria bacterium CG10_big_fil_rev_8_21_14_0_10_45_6]
MKKLITGIKPTGDIHLGNYIGTFKRLVELQKEYASAVFIADFHALNQLQDAKQLSHNTLELAKA